MDSQLQHLLFQAFQKIYHKTQLANPTCPHPKGTKTCFNDDDGITGLDWPTNWPDRNLIDNQWGNAKRKMSDIRPNNGEELKAAIEASCSSITP